MEKTPIEVKVRFEALGKADSKELFTLYNIHYAEFDKQVEKLTIGQARLDRLILTRGHIMSHDKPNMYIHHTMIRDSTLAPSDFKASLCMVHGFGENSDLFLEPAINYALNGFDVQLIDLRGFGLSCGPRCSDLKIEYYHHDVAALLSKVRTDIPCFLYGHSMGALTLTTFLINNPTLPIAGVILSAPFYSVPTHKLDEYKKLKVRALKDHLAVS